MSGTLKSFFTASGSLLNSNLRVSVVIILVLFGDPRVWFSLYGGSFARCVASHEGDRRFRV